MRRLCTGVLLATVLLACGDMKAVFALAQAIVDAVQVSAGQPPVSGIG